MNINIATSSNLLDPSFFSQKLISGDEFLSIRQSRTQPFRFSNLGMVWTANRIFL